MPRPFVLLLLLVAFPAVASGQQVALHPRVGASIDDAERTYFNLFRTWPAGTVMTQPATADSIRFLLTSDAERHATVSRAAFNEISTYVDRYEDSGFLEDSLNWQLVAPIGRFGNRFRPKPPVRYVGMNGSEVMGTLLRARNHELISLIGTPAYHWNSDASRRLVVRGSQLARIERSRANWMIPNRLLIGIGAIVGGTMWAAPDFLSGPTPGDAAGLTGLAAVTYGAFSWAVSRNVTSISGDQDRLAAVNQKLTNYAAFQPDAMPPELRDDALLDSDAFGAGKNATGVPSWKRARYLTVGTTFLLSSSKPESFIATGFGLSPAERRQAPLLHLDLSQDHSARWGYGVEATLALPTTAEENQVDYSGQLLTLHGDYYLVRPDYLTFSRRWEISAGAGLTAGRVESNAPVSFTRQITGLDPTLDGVETIGQTSGVLAAQVRLAASYVLDERTLLELRLSAWIPPIGLNADERMAGSNSLYTLDAVDLPLGASLVLKKRL